MTEVDFEKLVKLAENPEVSKTVGFVDSIVKDIDKIDKIIGVVDKAIQLVEKSSATSALIRDFAKKNDVSLEPLRKDSPEQKVQYIEVGLKPASDYHKILFEKLNAIPQEVLQKQAEEAAKNVNRQQPEDTKH